MAAVEELLFEARHGPFAIHSSAAVYHSLGTPRNAATLPYSELRLDNNVLDGPLESPPTRISVESSFQTSRRGSETLGIVLKEARGTRPILTRTFSTATVAAPEMSATDGSDSQSDKKKNKLGYTRNSMACSNCRRRKIRCVVSRETPHRCDNCFKFDKTCVFAPVDGPAVSEPAKPIPETKYSAVRRDSSATSPKAGPASPPERLPPKHALPQTNFSTPSTLTNQPGYFSEDVKVALAAKQPSSGPHHSTASSMNTPWKPADISSLSVPAAEENIFPFQAYHPAQSLSSDFPGCGQDAQAPTAWTSEASDGVPEINNSWREVSTPLQSSPYGGGSSIYPHGQFMPVLQGAGELVRQPSNFSDTLSSFTEPMPGFLPISMNAGNMSAQSLPVQAYVPQVGLWPPEQLSNDGCETNIRRGSEAISGWQLGENARGNVNLTDGQHSDISVTEASTTPYHRPH